MDEESALDAKRRRRFGACILLCLHRGLALSERVCAAERDPLHQGKIVERSKLAQRNFSLDLTSRLGKTQVVTNSTPLNQQVRAGFVCALNGQAALTPSGRPCRLATIAACATASSETRSPTWITSTASGTTGRWACPCE